jgi:alkylation response protein AidB-like acyl-CoA dehydrogenase
MNLDLSEEQRLLQQTAREFAEREVAPIAAKLDEEHRHPTELVARMAELGFMGVGNPEEWGGAGMDTVGYVLALEEIARHCASTAVIMSVNNSLVCDPLLKFGTEAQKREWLIPLASGKKLGCYALSEPNAGSDAAAQKTVAVQVGSEWELSGTKNFITNAPVADLVVLYAMTDTSKGVRGISGFLIPLKGTPGLTLGPPDKKMGIRGSQSCQIFLDKVRLPATALLGDIGQGFKIAMNTLDGGRIGIASQALGIARAAYEATLSYVKERRAFGHAIGSFQMTQAKIADMKCKLEAATLLTLRAAFAKGEAEKVANGRFSTEACSAKLFASEAAMWISHQAVQIHGGMGYSKEMPLERYFRDAKITEIYEGTSEIQRLVIARNETGLR